MAEDLYKILGVEKGASADELRTAYRGLAKKHHPDLNPGNKAAEERFKKVASAYELLSDAEKRKQYDAGEIDESGAMKGPPPGYRAYAEAPHGARYAHAGEDFSGFEDIFSNLFGERARGGPAPGRDAHYALQAGFLEAVNGATKRLTLPDGQTLDVKIPAGTVTGDVLRLRGKGVGGGDALIEIAVAEHAFFTREGQNIGLVLPISVREAVLGAKISVPTPGGAVVMNVKAGADTGVKMRLKGKGVPAHGGVAAGDLIVTLAVHVGPADAALEGFLKENQAVADFDPRAGMVP